MRTTFPGVDRGVSETCVARPLIRECSQLTDLHFPLEAEPT